MGLDWIVELYDDHDKFMNCKEREEEVEDDEYQEGDGYTYLRGKFVAYLFNEFLGSDAGNMCYGEEFERSNGRTMTYIVPSEFYRFKNLLHEVNEIIENAEDCKEEMKKVGYDDIDELKADIDFAIEFFQYLIDYNTKGNRDERSTMYIWCWY